MSDAIDIFKVNEALDTSGLADEFSSKRRVQVRDVLTSETARALRDALARQTPWGLAMQAADGEPRDFHAGDLKNRATINEAQTLDQAVQEAAGTGQYAFRYARFPMLQAYLERWNQGGLHDILIEHINTEPFLELVRQITGISELRKADGQVTLFGPQHFLGLHQDQQLDEGWRIAYVLNMTTLEWKPDWGGYLLFFDEEGDVVEGFMPRFNTLNLFAVPQQHSVSFVPPFAPQGRIAISGWFRDR